MIFLEKTKIFRDVIHGSIEVSRVANSIIDNRIFQRLRNLHQLGATYLVFSNANNTRFEHSIGTYYVAEKLLHHIVNNSASTEINNSILEIDFIKNHSLTNFGLTDTEDNVNFLRKIDTILLDDYIIELIKIAGLTHDLGHGPFSHLFDEWLHNSENIDKSNELLEHENRSIILLNKIIKDSVLEYNGEIYRLEEFIDEDAYNFISELINPKETTPNNFIFQIISNSLNGLDVDKLDYLCRDSFYLGSGIPFDLDGILKHAKVIDGNISFPTKISYDIYKVFRTRYDLHKQFYNHKTIVCIEYMIRNIMNRLEPILQIVNIINSRDLDKFIDLTDSVIFDTTKIIKNFPQLYSLYKSDIDYIEEQIDKINKRQIYKCLYASSFMVSEDNIDKKIEEIVSKPEDFLKHIDNFSRDNIKPIKILIGLLSGNKSHPFDNLYFFDHTGKSSILSKEKISHLLSPLFQEVILYVLYMD
jgi:HD superfamily phosphohydrolase